MPVRGDCSPAEMLGGGLPLQCSSLYEERYVLPSQTLNAQGSSTVQETHPLLGEWKVSTPCTCVHIHTGLPQRHPAPLWASLSCSSDPLILITGSWEESVTGRH